MSLQPLVRAREVSRTFGRPGNAVHALRGVSLDLYPGSLVALKGRSGSGKTTLLNCLGGLDQPTAGEVLFDGRSLSGSSDGELTLLRSRRIGYVFQSFALMPLLSAMENVEQPLRIIGLAAREREQRARECLELAGLTRFADHRPFELSGGQQQRVALARALAARPDLILADEPTGELDSRTGHQIMTLLRRLAAEHGVCVCLTTHDPSVMEMADVTYELVDGAVTNIFGRAGVTP